MTLSLEIERERDGRWLAEVAGLPGIAAHGATEEEAARAAIVIAFRSLALKIEQGEPIHQVSVAQVVRSREQFARGEYVTLQSLKAELAEK